MVEKRGIRSILNKKGEDGPASTVTNMAILGVFVVIVILALYFGYGYFKSGASHLPDSTVAAVTACKGFTDPSYFCGQPQEATLGGGKEQVNCDYPPIKQQLQLSVNIACPIDYHTWALQKCQSDFAANKVDGATRYNDVSCSTLTCVQLGGQDIDSASCAKIPGALPLTSGFSDSATFASKTPIHVCCANAPNQALVGKQCTSNGATGTIQNIDATTGSCATGKTPLPADSNSPNKPSTGQLCCSN